VSRSAAVLGGVSRSAAVRSWFGGTVVMMLLLAGCGRHVPQLTATRSPPPAFQAAAVPMPPLTGADAAAAAFRKACPLLVKRPDPSGLTQPGDWLAPCADRTIAAEQFFARNFIAVRVGDGRGLNTGYYEPELDAARGRAPGYAVPLYRRPPAYVAPDLGQFDLAVAGTRVPAQGAPPPAGAPAAAPDRGAIDDGALAGRGLELAWAADPYAAFFLEIQGSGRLRLPDGSIMRIGYDGQNGLPYAAIGRRLRDQAALAPGQATMAGIIGWLRSHPAEARALMRENRSKIYFRELALTPDQGPPGALGIPLVAQVSLAADPHFVPPGCPVWLETAAAGGSARLWVAHDVGGAIKGPNRFDLFWGSGASAGAVAGGISATGTALLLLPRAAVDRLGNASPRR